MSGMKFLGAFAASKLSRIGDAAASALARFDPETATAADIKTAESNYENLLTRKTQADMAYNAADRIATQSQADYDNRLKALGILLDKAEKETDPAQKEKLNASANAFEAEISKQRDIVKTQISARDAKKEIADTYREIASESLRRLQTARANAQDAAARLSLANDRLNIAKEKDEAQRLGEQGTTPGFGARALEQAASQAEIKATVLEQKNEALAKPTSAVDSDPAVQAALDEAAGKKPSSELSPAERLAALKLD